MEFLHKLWDETLAGPTPDSGLPELRKYNSFPARSAVAAPPPHADDSHGLIQSTTAVRSNAHRSLSVAVGPPSPSASSAPTSPFSPNNPGGNFKKLTRRKSTSAAVRNSESKSPTGYDWIVLSALDR
ncbi:Dormancy-associated protein4 [Sesamum angolense]|uniref:Dormancy-associated protein4 n=1 Tax=Sesamum angolense TaxID=2727404 RepID=A0AAE1T701_9LAMI|nr:Dormancy-associated protein4 [Sesamum angolense]